MPVLPTPIDTGAETHEHTTETNTSTYQTHNTSLSSNELENTSSSPVTKARALSYFGGAVTPVEIAVLSLYPLALFLGFLVQLAGGDSPSYFSNKRNLINVYIVKQGWLWLTLVIGYHAFTIYKRGSSRSTHALKNLTLRYSLATVWWILFSQWFFGLPIMDRIFILTGGACVGPSVEQAQPSSISISSSQCRSLGGSWTGGYDPSGHTFLITHSSLFLWNEILPYLHTYYKSSSTVNTGASLSSAILKTPFFKLSLVLLGLYWWMLLMTGVYFHSFFEKLFGLTWGYIEVVVVFVLSHYSPVALESVFGVIAV